MPRSGDLRGRANGAVNYDLRGGDNHAVATPGWSARAPHPQPPVQHHHQSWPVFTAGLPWPPPAATLQGPSSGYGGHAAHDPTQWVWDPYSAHAAALPPTFPAWAPPPLQPPQHVFHPHVPQWQGPPSPAEVQRPQRPRLVLMRGLPGSGKSTLAREIAGRDAGIILSTDDFFIQHKDGPGGAYKFDARRLGEAHEWNQVRCHQAMRERQGLIIIDNTNLQVRRTVK